MYIEFLIGYVLSAVLAVLLIVVVILQSITLVKLRNIGKTRGSSYGSYSRGSSYANSGIAICRNCATQFDAAYGACPRCGTPR